MRQLSSIRSIRLVLLFLLYASTRQVALAGSSGDLVLSEVQFTSYVELPISGISQVEGLHPQRIACWLPLHSSMK